MEIILLEKIRNLGDLGDSVRVANGYARNFLIPQKKAMRASEDALKQVEARRRDLAADESKRFDAANARAKLIAREIRVARLVAEGGKLYGSVSPADIAEILSVDESIRVEKSEVHLPGGPLKELGIFSVEVMLHPEVHVRVEVEVVADAADETAADAGDVAAETTDDSTDETVADVTADTVDGETAADTTDDTAAENNQT